MRWVGQFLISSLAAPVAVAGPWGQEDGNLFARVAYSAEQIDGAEAWRADVYGEYGLNQNWTAIAKVESVQFPNAAEFDAAEARLIFQRQMFSNKYIVVAAGGGLVSGAAIGGVDGCNSLGGEVRASIGSSGAISDREWYASVDYSDRWHSDGCQRTKMDFVTGFEIGKNTIISPQVYVERSNRGADSIAVQMEWIRQTPWFDLTVGYKYESGDLFEQQATIIAISRKF